jgi:hypothetical protein
MRSNKITAGQWKRKRPTGFVRAKRISIRARRRAYVRMLNARLMEQLYEGAAGLADTPTRTEV